MINKFKIGDSVVVVDGGETYSHYSDMFESMGFIDREVNDALDNGTVADVFEMEFDELQDEWMYAIRDDDGNECLIGESGLAYNVDVSPLNNVGKDVYIIHGNKIIKERVSKVLMSREESNDGTLMPLEESYYFVTLNLWKDVSEVYFDKEDLVKGL